MRVNRLVSTLRAMSSSNKPKKPLFTTELVRFLAMPDGKEHKVDYDPGDPIEVAEANRIFEELAKTEPAAAEYPHPVRFFTEFRRGCGVSPEVDRVKVFHSFRTTANSALRYQDVPQERRERLVGHEPEGTNNRSYRPADREKMFPIATLLEDLKRMTFSVMHSAYSPDSRHRTERLQAARRRIRRSAAEKADQIVLNRNPI